ncbi:MAG TPA: TenA family transcriptional regulator [Rubrobacteraceae bacterium]|nr:TenA family transcriptional regulator [Rubrobacteraceae bacterium]
MRAEDLLERHPELWRAATHHPFLEGLRDGSLPAGAFRMWLVQDYLFVNDLLVFQSRLLARSPRPAQAAIAGGLVALEAELGWFEEMGERRSLALGAPRKPATAAYRDLLARLDGESYAAGIVALWAIERAYLEAWAGIAPGHPDYREFVEHWTVPEFAGYVAGLEEAADAALEGASGDELQEIEEAFREVSRMERDFWEMALSEGDG